jgi:hypothetical protein
MDTDKKPETVLEVGEEKKEEIKRPVLIDRKDYSYLKKNKYEEQRKKWKKTFVLQHLKHPDKVVELRAASSFHACTMIHWKPNQVRVVSVVEDAINDVVDNVKDFVNKKGLVETSTSIV